VARPYEIRADFDRETIVIYQAYSSSIAAPALKAQRFVPPFSFGRMTWIKPSFLWLMHRSNWGQKKDQERTLAVRIKRSGWDKALSLAVLTSFDKKVFRSPDAWREAFEPAVVHLQWDTERSLRGAALPQFSIQIGLSRHIINEYVQDWIVEIEDYTPRVCKMRELILSGQMEKAKRLLPLEKVYPTSAEIAKRLLIV
jgi:hypothetical protein